MRLRTLLLAALPTLAMACAPGEDESESADSAVSNGVVKDIGHDLGKASSSEVLTKNEDAFEAKLAIIDGSMAGDTLDISYYIFSDDESGALYATRVVAAAKRGVKIRVMLDYLTNFTRYHYFKAMQDQAGQNLEFRFYNKPNANILEDARFLVTPCPVEGKGITSCTAERREAAKSPEAEAKAKLFLTGLYSKSGGALQAAMGPTLAQYQAEMAAAPATSPEDKARALEGLKLLFDAKVKNEFGAMLMVFFAGDKLAPLNQLWQSIVPAAADEHAKDWEHITDFSHQKLTLRTSAKGVGEVVVGGRNVENSYHVSELPPENGEAWKKKYVFMDVDLHASFGNVSKIKARFEKIWNFSDMVATMGKDLEGLTPVNLTVPSEQGEVPVLKTYTWAEIEQTAKRFTTEYASYDNVGKLTIKHKTKTLELADAGQFPKFDVSSDPNATFYYFDNVPNAGRGRTFGSDIDFGDEKDGGKEIQELWARSIADLCKKGDNGKVEIVFHNAYLSLPSRLQRELFERTKLLGAGTRFECEKGVSKVKILTNSRESTDLSIVNVYNEAWMKPTLQVDRAKGEQFLDYREYTTSKVTAKNPIARSLHAKVMIFGNDVFIGSANADGRSQFMDSNNGIFIRNAPNLSAAYRRWLTDVVEPDMMSGSDPRNLRERSIEDIANDNAKFVSAITRAKGQSEKVNATIEQRILRDSLDVHKRAAECLQESDKKCLSSLDQLLQPL